MIGFPSIRISPHVRRREAGKAARGLEAPVACKTDERDDLPAADRETHILESASAPDCRRGQKRFAGRRRRLGIHLPEFATDHQGNDAILGGLRTVQLADLRAVAQHRHPVDHALDLFEAMSNIEDGRSVRLQLVQDSEQAPRLFSGEGRGRLIEDEQLLLLVEHLENFEDFAVADLELLCGDVRIELEHRTASRVRPADRAQNGAE